MIPTKTATAEVTSNLTGETGKFQIDAAAMAHVMGVLSKLYSDEQLAVIREYSTNARDSHKEAGQTRPIEISLPSNFRRTLIIRDFGIGMDSDDLRDTYSHYGKSTKTSSNMFNGMLGMGSKSALAYTNSFTVVGRKNGVITKAIITKDNQSIPEFVIVDSRPTDEENGVEIQIPVRDTSHFADKAKSFFKWWEPGTVLVNGQEPAHHGLNPMDIPLGNRAIKVYATAQSGNSYYGDDIMTIVMGDVAYPVESSELRDSRNGANIAIFVPIGFVEFTPAREALVYDSDVRTLIKTVSNAVRRELQKVFVESVANAGSYKEAMTLWLSPPRIVRNDYSFWQSMTYKGEVFNGYVTLAETSYSISRDYNDRLRVSESVSLQKSVCTDINLIVTGVDSKPTTTFKRKVMKYAKDNNISVQSGKHENSVVLVDSDITSDWFSDIKRVDKDTIDKVKFPRPPRDPNAPAKPKVAAPGYDVYVRDSTGAVVRHPDVTKMPTSSVVYYHNADIKGKDVKHADIMDSLAPGTTVVELGKGRLDKFLKAYPKAKHLNAVIEDYAKTVVDGLSDLDYEVKSIGYTMSTFLHALTDSKDILDPELRQLADALKINSAGRAVSPKWEAASHVTMTAYRITGRFDLYQKVRDGNGGGTRNKITKRYPLVTGSAVDHSLIYVNAVYEAMYK